jgi:hypothetical protein
MFLVNDTIDKRHARIRSYLEKEPVIAVILAAVDFEWTIRRAILSLGTSPTRVIREEVLNKASGLDTYNECWKKEVKSRLKQGLAEVVPDWKYFKYEAYPLRHRLVHGAIGTTGISYARDRVEAILKASKAVAEFALNNGEPIYGRFVRRIKARQ